MCNHDTHNKECHINKSTKSTYHTMEVSYFLDLFLLDFDVKCSEYVKKLDDNVDYKLGKTVSNEEDRSEE